MPKQQADNCVHETAKNREKKKGRLSARNRTVDSIEPPSNESPPPSRYCAVRPSIFLAPDRLIKPGFRLRLPLERPIKALHQNARFFSFPPPSVREPRDRWPPDVRHPGTIYIDDKFLPSFH